MASTSSINSSSSGSQAPNPPPRTHSRPNQPPPPPPVPPIGGNIAGFQPIPPARDSSITISKTAITKHSPNPTGPPRAIGASNDARFLSQFEPLFKPIDSLPPPDPFMNKPKSYPSQRAQQKQSAAPKIPTC